MGQCLCAHTFTSFRVHHYTLSLDQHSWMVITILYFLHALNTYEKMVENQSS